MPRSDRAHWSQVLADLGACSTAVEWCASFDDIREAWATCTNPDWIDWVLATLLGNTAYTEALRRLGCDCCLPCGNGDPDMYAAWDWCTYLRGAMPVPTAADFRAVLHRRAHPWILPAKGGK